MKPVKLLVLMPAVLLTTALAGFWAYPHVIHATVVGEMPENWDVDYQNLSMQQLYDKMGTPDEDGGVKGFQNWVQTEWWGVKVLTVSGRDLSSDQTDFDVHYTVYVNGDKQKRYFGPYLVESKMLKGSEVTSSGLLADRK